MASAGGWLGAVLAWAACGAGCSVMLDVDARPASGEAPASLVASASSSAAPSMPPMLGASATQATPAGLSGDDQLLLAWRDDSRVYAVARGTVAAIVEPGGAHRVLPTPAAKVSAMTFSADGARLALSLTNGTVWVVDPSSSDTLLSRAVGREGAYALSFSPDGERLALVNDAALVLLDVTQDRTICQGPGAFDVAFAAQGAELVTTKNGQHARYDAGCQQLGEASSTTGGTFGSALSTDGAFVASSAEDGHTLEVKRASSFRAIAQLSHADSCQSHVRASWSQDGRVLLANGAGHWFESFDTRSFRRIARYEVPEPRHTHNVAMFGDGKRIALGYETRIDLVDAGKQAVVCSVPTASEAAIFPAPNSELFASVSNGSVHVIDAQTCKQLSSWSP